MTFRFQKGEAYGAEEIPAKVRSLATALRILGIDRTRRPRAKIENNRRIQGLHSSISSRIGKVKDRARRRGSGPSRGRSAQGWGRYQFRQKFNSSLLHLPILYLEEQVMIHPTILSTVKPDGSVQRYEGACDQVEGTVSVDGLPEHFNPGDYARMFIQLPGGSFLVDYLGGNTFQIVE